MWRISMKNACRYISEDGFQITEACRRYLQPLIEGEPPPFRLVYPDYIRQRISLYRKN